MVEYNEEQWNIVWHDLAQLLCKLEVSSYNENQHFRLNYTPEGLKSHIIP